MEIMNNNYKLLLAIIIGIAIGSILTHPADQNLSHSHNERNLADITTMTDRPGSTINSNNHNPAASSKKTPGGNEAQLRDGNNAAKQAIAGERENYRPVTTNPSNKKRVNSKKVRLADALD